MIFDSLIPRVFSAYAPGVKEELLAFCFCTNSVSKFSKMSDSDETICDDSGDRSRMSPSVLASLERWNFFFDVILNFVSFVALGFFFKLT